MLTHRAASDWLDTHGPFLPPSNTAHLPVKAQFSRQTRSHAGMDIICIMPVSRFKSACSDEALMLHMMTTNCLQAIAQVGSAEQHAEEPSLPCCSKARTSCPAQDLIFTLCSAQAVHASDGCTMRLRLLESRPNFRITHDTIKKICSTPACLFSRTPLLLLMYTVNRQSYPLQGQATSAASPHSLHALTSDTTAWHMLALIGCCTDASSARSSLIVAAACSSSTASR